MAVRIDRLKIEKIKTITKHRKKSTSSLKQRLRKR